MKKVILAIIAATTLTATPVLAAPGQSHDQSGRSQASHGQSGNDRSARRDTATKAHEWKRGERFDRAKATNYRVISNPRTHGLQTAPRGYRWVQSGRDALLVRLSNNIISSVVTGAIR